MKPNEREAVERYLRKRFGAAIEVRARPRKTDSAEVYLNNEFLGVLSRDDEEGEVCYHFAMSILDVDLEDA